MSQLFIALFIYSFIIIPMPFSINTTTSLTFCFNKQANWSLTGLPHNKRSYSLLARSPAGSWPMESSSVMWTRVARSVTAPLPLHTRVGSSSANMMDRHTDTQIHRETCEGEMSINSSVYTVGSSLFTVVIPLCVMFERLKASQDILLFCCLGKITMRIALDCTVWSFQLA